MTEHAQAGSWVALPAVQDSVLNKQLQQHWHCRMSQVLLAQTTRSLALAVLNVHGEIVHVARKTHHSG
jgi:hypothetical protein